MTEPWVSRGFGTGAVEVTPARDPDGFALGRRLGLPSIEVMDETAHMNAAARPYAGLDRYEARQRVSPISKWSRCSRSARPRRRRRQMRPLQDDRRAAAVQPWFIRIQPLADPAIAAVEQGHIHFTPERYAKTMSSRCAISTLVHLPPAMMGPSHAGLALRPLQRMPWHAPRPRSVPTAAAIASSRRRMFWIPRSPPVCCPCSSLGWPEHPPDLDTFYPTQCW